MTRIATAVFALSCLMMFGCDDSDEPSGDRDGKAEWSWNEKPETAAERTDRPTTDAVLREKFGATIEGQAAAEPESGFPALPAVKKPRQAVVGNPPPRNQKPKAIEHARPKPRPIAVPVANAENDVAVPEKQPAAPVIVAKPPVIAAAPQKRASGIDWHTTIPGALKEASASPGGGKPVLCFRVLGDVTGFM